MAGDREKCMAAGCDDYLAKPMLAAELQRVLARVLGHPATAADQLPDTQQNTAKPVGLLDEGFFDPATVAELVQVFTSDLPARVSTIENALRERDLRRLAEMAHQLKGTAGLYGFSAISHAARAVYQRAVEEVVHPQRLQAAVDELRQLCRHFGPPE